MIIKAIDEYNENGHLIYAENFIGAYARGRTEEEALSRLPAEIRQYRGWLGLPSDSSEPTIDLITRSYSSLQICDADSDIIFESEKAVLSFDEYIHLKNIVLKSARDFLLMYESIPDKKGTVLLPRKTFYGNVPITAEEMYLHTKSVNSYYFGEIGVEACNEPDIFTCRNEAFAVLENSSDYLLNTVYEGSYGEYWSLRKLFRRFIWHDRIHARAMYRMSVRLCGKSNVQNPFFFEI